LTRYVRKVVDSLLAAAGERRPSEFTPSDTERFLTDTGWTIEAAESTSPGRTDGTYLLAITAVPTSYSQAGRPLSVGRRGLNEPATHQREMFEERPRPGVRGCLGGRWTPDVRG